MDSLAAMIVFFIVNVIMFFAGFYFYKMTETTEKEVDEKDKIIAQLSILINELEETVSKRRIVGTFGGYEQ
ncbi:MULTISPECIES: hypothetical protein [unclassified Bartonella]|uniref:hypothetical protein n=1 Tax=unclassified Bartonella TaxID=2645622 RepID=UPI0035CEE64B